jgi:hypothetical protein
MEEMECEMCNVDPATVWARFDCGHEMALCPMCKSWSEDKGCPSCFW